MNLATSPTRPPTTSTTAPPGARRPSTARIAGVLYLTIIAAGLFAEVVVRSQLVIPGDPAATAANIEESAGLFRAGFAADVVMFLCDVALAVLLYRLLRPVNQTLSMLAAAFRLTQTAVIALNALSMFSALRILDQADNLGIDSTLAESLALQSLDTHKYGYILGLTFFGVSTLITGYLTYASGLVPRPLAALLVIAGAGYLADSFLFFLVPGYDGSASQIILAPAIIAESWLCGWLLLRGGALDTLAGDAASPLGRPR